MACVHLNFGILSLHYLCFNLSIDLHHVLSIYVRIIPPSSAALPLCLILTLVPHCSRIHKRKDRSPSVDAGSAVASVGPDVIRSFGVDGTPRKKAKAVSILDIPSGRSQGSGGRGRNIAGGKAHASPRSKDLLPPVTIVSRQRRTSASTRFVSPSIGDVSGDEIDSVVGASARGESDYGDDSAVASFVDVEVEESDGDARSVSSADNDMEVDWDADRGHDADDVGVVPGGRDKSGDEDGDGSALSDVNDNSYADFPVVDVSKRSTHMSVKTEKGKYVESLITAGQHSDVASDDDDFIDPTVSGEQVQARDIRVASDPDSSSVYLDDLYPDPILPRRSLGARATVLGHRGGRKGGSSTHSSLNRKLAVDVSVSNSDAVFDKTLVLAAPERSLDVDADGEGGSSAVQNPKVVSRIPSLPADSDTPSAAKKRGKARKGASSVTQTAMPPKSPSPKKRGRVSAVTSEPRALRSSSRAKSTSTAASKREPASPALAGGSSDAPMSGIAASILRLSGAKLRDAIGRLVGTPERDSSPDIDVTRPVLRLSSETRTLPSAGSSLDMDEPDDPELRVLLARFMEARLVQLKIYENMALIGPFRPVVPSGLDPDTYETPIYYTFDDIASLYKISSLACVKSLVEMFSFSHYGAFVNPARAPLGTLTVMNRKASVSNETAVCLMSGVVTECLLFDSTVIGGYNGASGVHGGKRMHRIRIKPFQQFWRRDQTVWAVTFDLRFGEATCISDSGIQFPTRVEDPVGKTNKNSKFPSYPATPARRTHVPKALKAASTLPGAGYASSMGFGDDIPIYDGHDRAGSHFLFWPSDFDNLTALPRYTLDRDLDVFTLVTVGYSLGVWSTYNDQPRVGTNVLFVIVLGSAPSRSLLEAKNLLN
ncbi:uncharacterized protein ARMOST_12223 [Armillaria ostoyae]|uniref:Uncharacterized protein n=1 Tax=Armillaria ostoyae TaxID=47428 RepID=A0A284RJD8_ARMOS|nr:uncharacterized protein ARMOST_12223 [Armillaria ostoyae]